MLQYIDWSKNPRKSKGEFKYNPTNYNNAENESSVIGVPFEDIFSEYDMSMVNNISLLGFEVLQVKGRKTKTGKQMAFVKVRDRYGVSDMVIFNKRYKELKSHKVYIMKIRGTQILDFTEAKKIGP
jgi:DNA polymerase III alpha subunit